jgi:hypothetical protein
MVQYLESYIPAVMENGLLTLKNASFGGTLAVAGVSTFAAAGTFNSTLNVNGSLLGSASITTASPASGVGYRTGAGGAVTQITSQTTGVTLSKTCGVITTVALSVAAEATASFIVTNTAVAITDTPVVAIQSGSNGGNTSVAVTTVTAGTFTIMIMNNNASAGTTETGTLLINFAIIKGVNA